MQDCFRKHPEIYGSELADDDDETPAEESAEPALAKSIEQSATPSAEEVIPKEATDATDANNDPDKTTKQ